MNKTERERLTRQENTLMELGFTADEADTLRRISRTLRRWYELECGTGHGHIERDDATGRPYWGCPYSGRRSPVPDRERGARRRLERIVSARNNRAMFGPLKTFIQTDPRGAALYVLRPGDVPQGADPAAYYTRGICVY